MAYFKSLHTFEPLCNLSPRRLPNRCLGYILVLCLCINSSCKTKLVPLDGHPVSPALLSQEQVTAYIFLSAECPISQKYTRTLNHLATHYPTVKMLGVFTKWHTSAEVEAFRQTFQTQFPLYIDPANSFAKDLSVTITPEVVLLNGAGTKLYQGAIDNWYTDLGKYRTEPTEHYVENAIVATLTGKSVSVSRTQAVGCRIEF